jgi:Fe-S cluster assembly protein SufD
VMERLGIMDKMSIIETQQNRSVRESDPYLASFEQLQNAVGDRMATWVYPIRKAGLAHFAEMGFPTTRDEDWRFTNVAPIAKQPFKPVLEPALGELRMEELRSFAFATLPAQRLVFVNGHFSEELSRVEPQSDGIQIKSLAAALAEDAELLEKQLARFVSGEQNAFAALNSAFFQDGAFIDVPAGRELTQPVHLLYISTAEERGAAFHPRNVIRVGAGGKLTLLESYGSTKPGAYFTNAATEIVLEENARLEHCKLQDESLEAYHMSTFHAQLGKGSHLVSHSFASGAKLSRNNIRTVLAGPGVECVLNGLYLTKDEQLADHHMIVEHASPHCNSHEYFNGILDNRSKGVFHGRILVQPGAQKTDAKQTNKNLLLTDDATANTKPQLEIYADDVKCTHGATIGQLNKESIFYLRARGIGEETARRMLIHAFAGEIIDRIQHEPAREELDRLFWDRLEENPEIAGKG